MIQSVTNKNQLYLFIVGNCEVSWCELVACHRNKIMKGHEIGTFLTWRSRAIYWKMNKKQLFQVWVVDFCGTWCEKNFCSLFCAGFVTIVLVLVYWRVELIHSSHPVCNNRTLCVGGGPTADITLNPVTKLRFNLQYKLDKCCNNVMGSSEMEAFR